MMGLDGLIAMSFALSFFLLFFGLWLWALVDAIRVSNDVYFRAGTRLIWVLVIIFLGWFGAVIYYFVGRPSKDFRPSTG